MSELVDLSMPPWQFVLRATLVYVALLVMIRLAGKRTVGEFTPFDLIVVILLGESMQTAMVGKDSSVLGPMMVAATLITLDYLIGFASARSRAFDRLAEGEPVIVARNGKAHEKILRKHNVPIGDLEEAVRVHGLADIAEVSLAVLETNGEITVVPRKRDRK